ncbi:hypothetical protein SAMN04487996_12942 [Dyadobacter soli]|uniref:Lipocalin-like domain-containing protein n=1 Tax=Dyadobacter soli TaxID=659014 RepID=A0A1G7ZX82_9BACT|nr:hypothetical protein [Dyadobacter soli]SDH13252.1 hypothetical protein SAMN04487996_12942 [Dyadobacter soli]
MKKYLIVMLFAAFFMSCSDDSEPDADLTKTFVGNWKGAVKVEKGYNYGTDWAISKVNDNTLKIVSTYNFVATDPKLTSETKVTTIENVPLTRTATNTIILTTTDNIVIPNDTLETKGTGTIIDNVLSITSSAKSKKTGAVTTPPIIRFTRQ